jgi:hypothetical protein
MMGDEEEFTLPSSDPTTYAEAMRSDEADQWEGSIAVEERKLEKLGTYEIVDVEDVPAEFRPIGSKFVFKTKRDKDGKITEYKSRMVANGRAQKDFKDVFAPVVRFISIRNLISLAVQHNYHVQQADINSAFPQADLPSDEIVYVKPPLGLRHLPKYDGKVLRLRKALYGLKQAGRVWNLKLHSTLVSLGYQRTRTDACVYVTNLPNSQKSYISIYVDDLLFVGPSMDEITRVKSSLSSLFGIKDLGQAEFLLGIQIVRNDSGGMWLGQPKYIKDVLARFGMTNCRPLATPLEPKVQHLASTGPVDLSLKRRYLQGVGSLMYAMLATRPDICHAVGYLSRFSSNPTLEHWTSVEHVLRYLRGTPNYGLHYSAKSPSPHAFINYTKLPHWTDNSPPTSDAQGYSDSTWADDLPTSRSTMGYVFTRSGGAISWASRLQSRVAGSSTEAEYLGLGYAGREAVFIQSQFEELGEPFSSPLLLYGDNQGANALTKEARFHDRTKHIRLSEHLARELVEGGTLQVEYIPTERMLADIMTKPLARVLFDKFRDGLGVVPMPI